MIRWISIIAIQIFCISSSAAQATGDTIRTYYSRDTSPNNSGNQSNKNIVFKKIPYTSFIVPAVMVAYGFAEFNIAALTNLNHDIQKEIWTNHPHGQQHIDNYLQYAPAATVYVLNIAGVKGKNNLIDRSMIYLMSNIIMGGSVYALKQITHKQRPDGSDYLSFPSGHTAEAFASAEFLYQEYKDVSIWYGIAGYGAAAFVGVLRMYNNKHWFNDVVAGAGMGIASTRLAYWLYPRIKNIFYKKREMHAVILPTYEAGTFGLAWARRF